MKEITELYMVLAERHEVRRMVIHRLQLAGISTIQVVIKSSKIMRSKAYC